MKPLPYYETPEQTQTISLLSKIHEDPEGLFSIAVLINPHQVTSLFQGPTIYPSIIDIHSRHWWML